MEKVSRKALFVLYEFPPEGARGTKRAIMFLKFLRLYNWQTIVLTAKNPHYDFQDESLLLELPRDLIIYRASTLENIFRRSGRFHRRKDRRAGPSENSTESSKESALLRLYHMIGRAAPVDSKVLWLPLAIIKGLIIAKKEKVDLIFASGPSFMNHVAGMMLKRFGRVPLVIDFRDAWASDPAGTNCTPRSWKYVSRLERRVVRAADRVVATTDGIKDDFINRYGLLDGKFVTITNGYNPDDFAGLARQEGRRDPLLRIVHAGTLGGERSPRTFLKALGELESEEPSIEDKIQVVFVGQNNVFNDGMTIHDYIRDFSVSPIVKIIGFVGRRESLEYIFSSDLLLLIIGDVPEQGRFVYGISGKIYDYAASGKRVLTISEDGASACMVRKLNLGCVISPNNTLGIKQKLMEYLDEFSETGKLKVNTDYQVLRSFDFKQLSASLASCFNSAVCDNQGRT